VDFERLARRVYRDLRNGVVDLEAAFDLACLVLEKQPLDPDAAELAALSLEMVSQERIAAAARQVLAERFEPGFAEEPGWLAALEEAMSMVNADMRASELPGTGRLVVDQDPDCPPRAWVETWDGYRGSGGGIFPGSGSDPLSALVAVADDAQDAVMESVWEAWPVCPAHRLGVHPGERDGAAAWWCKGGGGHVAAAIGGWDAGSGPGRS
jgi:hypothetical protein